MTIKKAIGYGLIATPFVGLVAGLCGTPKGIVMLAILVVCGAFIVTGFNMVMGND